MLVINWKLGLIVLAMIPLIVTVAIQFRKKILAEYRIVRKFNSKITGSYNENISGVRVVKALGREDANLTGVQPAHLPDVSIQLPGCLALSPFSAHSANHQRLCFGSRRLVRRHPGGIWQP